MSDLLKPLLGRGAIHSLTGLGIQTALAGLLLWITRTHPDGMAWHALWPCLAGILAWVHLLATYGLLRIEAPGPADPAQAAANAGQAPAGEFTRQRIRWLHRAYYRVMVPVMELGVAVLLGQSARAALGWRPPAIAPLESDHLLLIALYSVATLILIVFGVYLTGLMKARAWHLLKIGRNITGLMVVLAGGLLLGACGDHFGVPQLTAALGWGFIAVNTLLTAEVLLLMVLRFFSPRRSGDLPRPAFDVYLLEGLSRPHRLGQTFAVMLANIFGFDVTRTSFGRVVQSLILPAIAINGAILWGLSAIVIVKPYEQAIVLNLGRLAGPPLQAGLHVKRPWPLASVRHYDTDRIRSIHVGSHKPVGATGDIYREGVPILWTNMHGLNIDELLICSSPQHMDHEPADRPLPKANTHRVPSVSLAAADIRIQYRIDRLLDWVRSSATPEDLLRKIAETHASRLIYRYDIDALFTESRLALVDALQRTLEAACTRRRLGVTIVHVAITAAHPPVEVADDFEATVVALQEKETRIQQARQAAIQSQVETVGSAETFGRLSTLADRVDRHHEAYAAHSEGLLQGCGGDVSQILAEARSYRFSRENRERGTTERFAAQLRAFNAAPRNYRYDTYFATLEKGLAANRKVVLLGNGDQTFVRMGVGEGAAIDLVPDILGDR